MAVRKTFNIATCKDCVVAFGSSEPGCLECRLNPPVPVTQYTSAYPVVRPDTPACFAGIAGSKPKPKGAKKK
jgi:hypothetical protein